MTPQFTALSEVV